MRPRCVPTCRGRTYSGQLTSIRTRNDPSSRTPLHCGATPAMPGRLQQCMELMRGSFDQPGVFSAREQWTTRSERPARHDVWREQAQAGSIRRQLLLWPGHHAGAERWAGPSGAARRSTPGRQMFERGVNAALAFAAAAAALASCSVRVSGAGIVYCLSVDWFSVAAGFSGACEGPGRSFHPTAVERRNGPSAPRWVENKLNEINGVRQIERQAPHRAGRVELLRHRDERHSLGVEEFD